MEAQEDYLRREAKLLKREGTPPPPPPPRDLAEAYKARPLEALGPLKLKPAHEGLVATVKEAGRSIHEIPREELRRTPELPLAPRPLKEGSITQVTGRLGRTAASLASTNGETEARPQWVPCPRLHSCSPLTLCRVRPGFCAEGFISVTSLNCIYALWGL